MQVIRSLGGRGDMSKPAPDRFVTGLFGWFEIRSVSCTCEKPTSSSTRLLIVDVHFVWKVW